MLPNKGNFELVLGMYIYADPKYCVNEFVIVSSRSE